MATKNEKFLEEFGIFQGNLTEELLNVFYDNLPKDSKSRLLLLINTEPLFKKAFALGLTFDGTNNVDTQWKMPYTVEHIQLLESYNYPRLIELYKNILERFPSNQNKEAAEYILQNISYENFLQMDKDDINAEMLKQLNKNNNFDLFKYIEKRKSLNKRIWLRLDCSTLMLQKYGEERVIEYFKNSGGSNLDLLSYMVNNKLVSRDVLNLKNKDGVPLFNNFRDIECYIDQETGLFFDNIDFSLCNGLESNIVDLVLKDSHNNFKALSLFFKSMKPEYHNLTNHKNETVAFVLSNYMYHADTIQQLNLLLNSNINLSRKNKQECLFYQGGGGLHKLRIIFQIISEKEKWNIEDKKYRFLLNSLSDDLKKVKEEIYDNSRISLKNGSLNKITEQLIIETEKRFLKIGATEKIEHSSTLKKNRI